MRNKAAPSLGVRMLVIGPLLAVYAVFAAGSASAGCAKFPSVPWWSGTTHESVKRYVKIKNGGNWSGYINKWENQLKFLRDVEAKGGSAVVANYKLKGVSLKQYIEKVTARVSVTRCLSSEVAGDTSISKKAN